MLIKWNPQQLEMLSKMNVPFNAIQEMTDDQLDDLYEIVPDYLEFDSNGEPTEQCLVVESMIDALAVAMQERDLF